MGRPPKRHRILVVEDEESIATYLQKTLNAHGYDVFATAPSAADALQKAREQRPDLVLMDIHIKGDKDGVDTARVFNEEWNIPVVFLTAFADQVTVERAQGTSPYGYVLKPIKSADLRQAIETALSLRGRPHALARFRLSLFQRLLPSRSFSEEAFVAYRQAAWGKRDTFVWGLGVGGALDAVALWVLGVLALRSSQTVGGAIYLVAGVYGLLVSASMLKLQRWARLGIFGLCALGVLGAAATARSPLGGVVRGLSEQMVLLFFAVLALNSPRNQLAFQIESEDAGVRRSFRGYCDNVTGQYGFLFALVSVLMPPVAFVSLPLSAVGYARARRVDAVPLVALPRLSLAGALISLWAFVEFALIAYAITAPRAP